MVFTEEHHLTAARSERYLRGMEMLVSVVQKLSHARNVDTIVDIVRHAARELTGADGATFILRDHDRCYYVDEDAIGPLWKGRKFPMDACISGWAMLHRENVFIEDIYQDPRIPIEAYRPTFVKSLVMVPIRKDRPLGAIGTYWANSHLAQPHEVNLLQSLADSTSIALENVRLFEDLQESLQEARSARDEIARQLNLRDEFVSVTAHELRTPLTPVLLQAQFLDRLISNGQFKQHPLENYLQKFSKITQKQMGDLRRLIEDLLDTSRIRLEQFQVNRTPDVNVGTLIQELIEQYQPLTQSPLSAKIEEPIVGSFDPLRLKQLFRNLLANAISYGLNHPISIQASHLNDRIQIVVEDHGMGISPQNHERIFNRFERATSVKSFGGLGLGLFIAREIVKAHQGTIRVESEVGQGSRFIVDLPAFVQSSLSDAA